MKDEKRLFYVINEEGIRQEAEVLAKFKLINGLDYISYTFGEINDNDMIKIYSTGITGEKGNYEYKEIETTTEWEEIKNLMKLLAKEETSDLPDENKSNLQIVGEEISINKPKKLLVSNKFATSISSKYKEEVVEEKTPEEFINNEISEEINTTNLEENTINVPTFEELQAKNRKVEEVIDSVRPETVEEPVVEEELVKPEPVSVEKPDYKEKFKQEVEPLLLDVYAKQQKQIEELEEELSKTKFDLFEKQKETLSLKKENDELAEKGSKLETELNDAQKKMDGILNVLRGTDEKELEEEKI